MSIGRWVAGCAGVLLILPGLCFLVAGVATVNAPGAGEGIGLLLFGLIILVGAGYLLFKVVRTPEVPLEDSPNVVTIRRPTEPESPKEPAKEPSQEPAPPKEPPTSDA